MGEIQSPKPVSGKLLDFEIARFDGEMVLQSTIWQTGNKNTRGYTHYLENMEQNETVWETAKSGGIYISCPWKKHTETKRFWGSVVLWPQQKFWWLSDASPVAEMSTCEKKMEKHAQHHITYIQLSNRHAKQLFNLEVCDLFPIDFELSRFQDVSICMPHILRPARNFQLVRGHFFLSNVVRVKPEQIGGPSTARSAQSCGKISHFMVSPTWIRTRLGSTALDNCGVGQYPKKSINDLIYQHLPETKLQMSVNIPYMDGMVWVCQITGGSFFWDPRLVLVGRHLGMVWALAKCTTATFIFRLYLHDMNNE